MNLKAERGIYKGGISGMEQRGKWYSYTLKIKKKIKYAWLYHWIKWRNKCWFIWSGSSLSYFPRFVNLESNV